MTSTARQQVRLVAVLPMGPGSDVEYVRDTLASIYHYCPAPVGVVLIDDSGEALGQPVRRDFPQIDLIVTPGRTGGFGGLYYTESLGLLRALALFDFEIVLKMDVDALITGPAPENDAAKFFAAYPDVGIGGSHRVDCMGQPRGYGCAKQLQKEASLARTANHDGRLGLLRQPKLIRRTWLLGRLLKQAYGHGYELGDSVLGGAYFVSRALVDRLAQHRLLARKELITSRLGEDHLFSLLSYAVGMRIGDLASDDRPLGVRWQGLPCSPEELVTCGKKVIHSTNFFENQNEDEIREFFRKRRSAPDQS